MGMITTPAPQNRSGNKEGNECEDSSAQETLGVPSTVSDPLGDLGDAPSPPWGPVSHLSRGEMGAAGGTSRVGPGPCEATHLSEMRPVG